MVTKLRIYNRALGFVGDERLHPTNGLTENRTARVELDAVYDEAIEYCLSLANWKFALRTSRLTYDVGSEPDFGPRYAFEIPSDFKRLAGISINGEFRPEYEPDYLEENGFWYADIEPLYVRYVSNDEDYGTDLSRYTEQFIETLASWMAMKAGPHINKTGFRYNAAKEKHQDALRHGKVIEAIDEPVKTDAPGRWASSRSVRGRTRVYGGRMRWS